MSEESRNSSRQRSRNKLTPSPQFSFYPNDWLSSNTRNKLSLEEQGAFINLLCRAWNSDYCQLPDDDEQLAQMSGLGKRWFKNGAGERIKKSFAKRRNKLVCLRLKKEWEKQHSHKQKSSKGGTNSAKARRRKRLEGKSPVNAPSEQVGSNGQPKGNLSISNSISNTPPYVPSEGNSDNPGPLVQVVGFFWRKMINFRKWSQRAVNEFFRKLLDCGRWEAHQIMSAIDRLGNQNPHLDSDPKEVERVLQEQSIMGNGEDSGHLGYLHVTKQFILSGSSDLDVANRLKEFGLGEEEIAEVLDKAKEELKLDNETEQERNVQ